MRIEIASTIFFALAVIHTLMAPLIRKHRKVFEISEKTLHFCTEVEVIFGFWTALFLAVLFLHDGAIKTALHFRDKSFAEPVFVFVILIICATKPILSLSTVIIEKLSGILPFQKNFAFYLTTLSVGPLLGSFITEVAAMTVVALILADRYFSDSSENFRYATLGLLFVNISIGGTLTPYSAPPILMVAKPWKWDFYFMLANFGWKGALATFISTVLVSFYYRKEIKKIKLPSPKRREAPIGIALVNVVAIGLAVYLSHSFSTLLVLAVFVLFWAFTLKYQSPLKWKSAILVGVFLLSLVMLCGFQEWWLREFVKSLNSFTLYTGSVFLTAFLDNAALTYLGTQIGSLSDSSKYYLVAGAVVGGGLTVIANAPNPVGYGILGSYFGKTGIRPLRLFRAALVPTIVGLLIFAIF